MRIMQLYRIENDYKTHKKRLQSIRTLDSKQKIERITSHHFHANSQLKKIKAQDHSFREKEELTRREHSLSLMNRTITDRNRRIKQQYDTIGALLASKKNSPNDSKEHLNELLHLNQKIANMRSTYHKFRSRSEVDPELQKPKKNSKDKVLDLLRQHFKIEPTVVFPKTKGNIGHLASEPGQHLKTKQEHMESMVSTDRPL